METSNYCVPSVALFVCFLKHEPKVKELQGALCLWVVEEPSRGQVSSWVLQDEQETLREERVPWKPGCV